MPIKIIQGKPGCGKTHTLKTIYNSFPEDCLILCYTHSNCKLINLPNTHTIHSYFKADYNNNVKRLFEIPFKYILVDEFTLVPNKLLKIILKYQSNHQIILFGDILQLSCISKDEMNFNLNINFDTSDLSIQEISKIYYKLSNSIYSKPFYNKSDQMLLKYNYRNNDRVIRILNDALNNKYELLKINELIKKVKLKNYTVISSRYKHLKYINEIVNEKKEHYIKTKIGLCDPNQDFILCETLNKKFVNGQVLNPDEVKLLKQDKKPIIPTNFITCHKSQGLQFDKVICLLDDLFDISFLYTMISRAKLNVKFYICSMNDVKVKSEIISNNRCLKIIEDLIYNPVS